MGGETYKSSKNKTSDSRVKLVGTYEFGSYLLKNPLNGDLYDKNKKIGNSLDLYGSKKVLDRKKTK
jgi:hypothetical protein